MFYHFYNLALSPFSTVLKTLAGDSDPHRVIGNFSLQPEDSSFLILSGRLKTQLLGLREVRAGSQKISFQMSQHLLYTDHHSCPLLRAYCVLGAVLNTSNDLTSQTLILLSPSEPSSPPAWIIPPHVSLIPLLPPVVPSPLSSRRAFDSNGQPPLASAHTLHGCPLSRVKPESLLDAQDPMTILPIHTGLLVDPQVYWAHSSPSHLCLWFLQPGVLSSGPLLAPQPYLLLVCAHRLLPRKALPDPPREMAARPPGTSPPSSCFI